MYVVKIVSSIDNLLMKGHTQSG